MTAGFTAVDLATPTDYTSYHCVSAGQIRRLSSEHQLGYELWPTDTFEQGEPDPRNPVHFDLVVAVMLPGELKDRTGSPAERRDLRRRLLSRFSPLLDSLSGPYPLYPDA